MEANSMVSSARFTGAAVPSVLSSRAPNNKRRILVLPAVINRLQQGCATIGLRHKKLSFRPKAAQRESLEAIVVPTSVPVRVAHELVQAGHRYLDVRTPEEFSAGHAVGAINVPYMYKVGSGMTNNTKFMEQVSSHFGKYDEIIVVRAPDPGCQSGKRSLMAAAELLAAGYTSITDVAGGYAVWRQNGLPTQS